MESRFDSRSIKDYLHRWTDVDECPHLTDVFLFVPFVHCIGGHDEIRWSDTTSQKDKQMDSD